MSNAAQNLYLYHAVIGLPLLVWFFLIVGGYPPLYGMGRMNEREEYYYNRNVWLMLTVVHGIGFVAILCIFWGSFVGGGVWLPLFLHVLFLVLMPSVFWLFLVQHWLTAMRKGTENFEQT